jgi:hypothetical protein
LSPNSRLVNVSGMLAVRIFIRICLAGSLFPALRSDREWRSGLSQDQ